MLARLSCICVLALLLGSDCPMTPPDTMPDNTNDNTSGPDGNPAPPSNNNGNPTLTLRITGPANGAFARVYGIVDDGPQDHAALDGRFPQSDFQVSLTSNFGDMIEMQYSYPAGTRIALVAVESDGFLTVTPPPNPIVEVPMQFSQWAGDFVTADIGPNPATLYFDLTEDRTITAEFRAMDPIFIEAQGGGPESNVIINVDVDRYIVPPEAVEQSGVGVSDNPDALVLWGYHRDGAILNLQIRDYEDNSSAACANPMLGPCYVFITWNGDCLGAGKTCELTFGQDGDATVILQDQN